MADQPTSDNLRLFVALRTPDDIQSRIQHLQAELRHELRSEAIRWSPPHQFHLTLKFLGSVSAARIETLLASLRTACRRFGPLRLRAEKLGFFPNAHSPRVLWVGVTDQHEVLNVLQGAIETATAPFSAEPNKGRFLLHITLARIKEARRSDVEALNRLVTPASNQVFGEWTTKELELMRSELRSNGAEHFTMAHIPLEDHP